MTDLSALRDLREKVAVGIWDPDLVHSITEFHTDLTWKAYQGSLDAAKALHEAELPGWEVGDLSVNGSIAGHPWGIRIEYWDAYRPSRNMSVSVGWGRLSFDGPPSRIWLLAILDALIATSPEA